MKLKCPNHQKKKVDGEVIIGKLFLLMIAWAIATKEFKLMVYGFDWVRQTVLGFHPILYVHNCIDNANQLILHVEEPNAI
jgi:hypothetical protein